MATEKTLRGFFLPGISAGYVGHESRDTARLKRRSRLGPARRLASGLPMLGALVPGTLASRLSLGFSRAAKPDVGRKTPTVFSGRLQRAETSPQRNTSFE